jgi:hypothetical protein
MRERDYSAPHGYIKDYEQRSLHKGIDWQTQRARHASKELKRNMDYIPRIPEKSEMPAGMLAILYQQKNEAHKRAEKEANGLRGLLEVIERELKRCRNNLRVVEANRGSLHSQSLDDIYGSAVSTHSEHFKWVVEQRLIVKRLLAAMEVLLHDSSQRQPPGDEQRRASNPASGRSAAVPKAGASTKKSGGSKQAAVPLPPSLPAQALPGGLDRGYPSGSLNPGVNLCGGSIEAQLPVGRPPSIADLTKAR